MPLTLSLSQTAPEVLDTALLVVALGPEEGLPATLATLDAQRLGSAIARTLARRDFRGGRDETLHVGGAERGVQRVLLVGLGKATDRALALRRAAAVSARFANKLGVDELTFVAADADGRAV